MGSDPEIFLTRGGKIVGSERVIPEDGIILNQVNDHGRPLNPLHYDERLAAWTSSHGAGGSIVRDGVQAELHPTPVSCRAIMGVQFAAMFRVLHQNILRSKEFKRAELPDFPARNGGSRQGGTRLAHPRVEGARVQAEFQLV
jgi:hypothetical protein